MVTIRNIERMWNSNGFSRLFRELMDGRAEALVLSSPLVGSLQNSVAAAAMAMIRLDELSLSHAPIFATLQRHVLATQQPDGGWGDPAVTALAARALTTGRGQGLALDAAFEHLAALQREDGLWPAEGFRRMPGDTLVTAFILLQLGGDVRFAEVANVNAASAKLDEEIDAMDPLARRLSSLARMRQRTALPDRSVAMIWS